MNEISAKGITSYYHNLGRGEKDKFVREVAEAIGQSFSNVSLKMRNGGWSVLELPAINNLIKTREK